MPPKRKDEKKEAEEAAKEEVGVFYLQDTTTKYDGQITKKGDPPLVKRNGFGLLSDCGTVYDGQWIDDVMQGEGTINFDTGASYAGTFLNNTFHGRGKYTWPDGSSYEGQWRCGKIHGEGCFTDIYSKRWIGRFYDGQGHRLLPEM